MSAGNNSDQFADIRETLVRMEVTLEHLNAKVASFTEGDGPSRCAERGLRLKQLEDQTEKLFDLPGSKAPCIEVRDKLRFLETKFDTLSARLWWFAGSSMLAVFSIGLRSLWSLLATS